MGLSRKNPTKHIQNLRMIPEWVKGEHHHQTGYRNQDYNCDNCGVVLCPCGTRQYLCKKCMYEKNKQIWNNPERRKKKKEKILANPEKLKLWRESQRIKSNERNLLKSVIANKKCVCGKSISWDSKNCRNCVDKKSKHFYKFLICQINECGGKHLAKGLCGKHYQRLKKGR